MCCVLCAGTQMEDWNNLRGGIDGQPEPEDLLVAAQPGTQFIQLEVREPEMAEGALVQGLCVLGSVQNQYLLAAVIVVCAFIDGAMYSVSLLIYVIFLTIYILIQNDFSTPGSLTDVRARILNVFIGALISVVVVFLFMRPSQKTESSSVASG